MFGNSTPDFAQYTFRLELELRIYHKPKILTQIRLLSLLRQEVGAPVI